jgi:GDP-L-fucose synthase
MNLNSKIYITGADGLVGSAVVRELKRREYTNVATISRWALNLMSLGETVAYFAEMKPEYVINCAAKVGGIGYNNTYGADIISQNLTMQNNIIMCSHQYKVKKLIFLGSSCVYPKYCQQPMKEEYLLTGSPETTNIGYSLAKLAGIIECAEFNKQYGDNFISVLPCNIYGERDNFNIDSGHVVPAMIRKFHEAKEKNIDTVELWGTGTPKRELMYSDDLADALIFLMENYDGNEPINVGTGKDITIADLAEMIKETVGYKGAIRWNSKQPDGTPLKRLDVSRLNALGWTARFPLYYGIEKTYKWYLENYGMIKK